MPTSIAINLAMHPPRRPQLVASTTRPSFSQARVAHQPRVVFGDVLALGAGGPRHSAMNKEIGNIIYWVWRKSSAAKMHGETARTKRLSWKPLNKAKRESLLWMKFTIGSSKIYRTFVARARPTHQPDGRTVLGTIYHSTPFSSKNHSSNKMAQRPLDATGRWTKVVSHANGATQLTRHRRTWQLGASVIKRRQTSQKPALPEVCRTWQYWPRHSTNNRASFRLPTRLARQLKTRALKIQTRACRVVRRNRRLIFPVTKRKLWFKQRH